MKRRYDRKAISRALVPGDQVLVLLPIQGSSMSAWFLGPYAVERKLRETDYVIKTPDRKRKTRMCHLNMLKLYHVRDSSVSMPPVATVGVAVPSAQILDSDEDGLDTRRLQQQTPRLSNSDVEGPFECQPAT